MTMLVMSTRNKTKGPKSSSGVQQENTRLFMDDITTTTETVAQTHHLLGKLSKMLQWGRLEVKIPKCRSLVLMDGKIKAYNVKFNNEVIIPVMVKPIKYLGKEYNLTLKDSEQIKQTVLITRQGLRKIDRSLLPGKFKCWILQNVLLSRIMWPLTLYDTPFTKMEEIQNMMTASTQKWLGLPKSLSVDMLYSKTTKAQLPYTSLVEDKKAAKVRSYVTMKMSRDPCIS